jgi:hypothetical protein
MLSKADNNVLREHVVEPEHGFFMGDWARFCRVLKSVGQLHPGTEAQRIPKDIENLSYKMLVGTIVIYGDQGYVRG